MFVFAQPLSAASATRSMRSAIGENFNCKTTGVGLYSFPEGQAEKRESKRHVTVQAIVAGPIVDLSDQLEVQRAATWILWDGSP